MFGLELRNRAERDARSTGYKLRFESLEVDGTYDAQTIRYSYDALARLLDAKYYPGQNTGLADANLLRRYQYAFDRSGNRTQQIVTLAGTPTTTNYSYNAANQLTSDGVNTLTYDNNGNLTNDGTNAYTWDRANRLLSMGGATYVYDGAGNRTQQTMGANVTQYLLDVQPGLAVVLAETTGASTARYVHGPRGVHARKDAANAWHWSVQDGLGSVRMEASNSLAVEGSRDFDPFGNAFGTQGTFSAPYEFTGESKDSNGLLYLRTRYLNPALGVFTALDPFEGIPCLPMSLNGYSWVEGNPINGTDPNGECGPLCIFIVLGLFLALAALLTSGCTLTNEPSTPIPPPTPLPPNPPLTPVPTAGPTIAPPGTSTPNIPVTIPPINTLPPTGTPTPTIAPTQGLITLPAGNINTSPCSSQKFYPPFGDNPVCPQSGQCKPIPIGNLGYQQSGPHRARDYVPTAASGQTDSWENQPALAQYNRVYAVADGNIIRVTDRTAQQIPDAILLRYNVDPSGNGWEFVYFHIALDAAYDPNVVGIPDPNNKNVPSVGVTKGTLIGTLINYLQASDVSGDPSDVTHLHFGVRVYPLSEARRDMNDDPDHCF